MADREHHPKAESLLELEDRSSLRYACLELRLCIERLATDKMKMLEKYLEPDELATWQPKRIVDVLAEHDRGATDSHMIRVFEEDAQGEPIGEGTTFSHTAMPMAAVRKHYNKLGSFLHIRTLAQQAESPRVPDADLKRYLLELLELLRPAADSGFDSAFGESSSLSCVECGSTIIKKAQFIREHKEVTCPHPGCRAKYRCEEDPDGKVLWELKQAEFRCPECEVTTYFGEHRMEVGGLIKCAGCEERFELGKQWVVRKVSDV